MSYFRVSLAAKKIFLCDPVQQIYDQTLEYLRMTPGQCWER